MGEFIAFISLLMFSLNVIVTKVASSRLDLNIGFLIAISVNVLFSGLLFLGLFYVNPHPLEFHWFGFFMFVLAGLFSTYLGRFMYFESIAKLGPSKASSFMVSNPLFTVIIASFLLGEMLSLIEFAAVLIVLLGLFLVSYIPQKSSKPVLQAIGETEMAATSMEMKSNRRKWREIFQPGVALALFGSIAYAVGNITRGAGVQDWNEPILGGFIGAVIGLVLQLLFNKQARTFIPSMRSADTKAVWLYAASGVLTISGQIGQIASMRYIPVSIATLITMSQPLLVIPLSYFLLKNQEGLNARIISGSLLVLFGIGTILLF